MEYKQKEAKDINVSSYGTTFILPNGNPWNGDVHKMTDGSWMTGKDHNKTSVSVFPIPSFINFPIEGNVATQAPLNELFEYVSTNSELIETSLASLSTRITEVKQIIVREAGNADSIIKKLEQLRDDSNVQGEVNGSGTIIEVFNKPLVLEIDKTVNHNTSVSSISFIPFSDKESFIHFGNIETGSIASDWSKITTENISAEIISGRNIALEDITSDNNTTFSEEFRNISSDYLMGFSGKLIINFGGSVVVNKIVINTQTDAEIKNITYNESTIDQLNGDKYSTSLLTDATSVQKISLDLDYFYPVPFNSYAYKEESGTVTDLLGDSETISNLSFTDTSRIYQKTRLEMGPVYILSELYKQTTEIISDPYVCKNGTLNSIFILVDEKIPDSFATGNYIEYFVTINGNDYPITPQNKEGPFASTLFINSKLGDAARTTIASSSNVAFLDIDSSITWTMKYKITRPISSAEKTPSLNSINLIYTTSEHEGII